MIFRKWGNIFGKTPKGYYAEAYTTRDALVSRCVVLQIEIEIKRSAGLSTVYYEEQLDAVYTLAGKLIKTAQFNVMDMSKFQELVSEEYEYVTRYMAKS